MLYICRSISSLLVHFTVWLLRVSLLHIAVKTWLWWLNLLWQDAVLRKHIQVALCLCVLNQNYICDSESPCYAGFWWIVFCEKTMRDFFACHSYLTLLYLLLKDCVPVLRYSAVPEWTISHTHTLNNKDLEWEWWKAVLTCRGSSSCSWARPVTQEDGGWRREREEVQDIDLPELQVQTGHNRHKSLRETDRLWSPAVLLILSVNLGRIWGSFIIIFSWVTADERWNT